MSVINQMLRDLDKRGASRDAADAASFAAKRQAVETRRVGSDWFWRTSAFLALVAVAWVAWLIWELRPRSLVMEVALRTPVPAARSQPRAVQRDGDTREESPAVEARTQSGADMPAQSAGAVVEPIPRGGLRLLTQIAVPSSASSKPASVPASESGTVSREIPGPTPRRVERPANREAAPSPREGLTSVPSPKVPAGSAVDNPPPRPVVRAEDARIEKREVSNAMERAEAEYRAAVALIGQGRMARAVEGLRQALAYDASHEGARQTLVGIYVQDRRFDLAEALLNEGLAINPRQLGFAMALARITVERGSVARALDILDRHATSQTQPADYRAFRAALQQRLGRHGEAVEEYRAALARSPEMSQWWIGLGISQQAQALDSQALESFRRAKATGNLNADLTAFVDQRIRQLQR